MEFTTVIGVDQKHLEQLKLVLPTWDRFKVDVMNNPMLLFYDREQLTVSMINEAIPEYASKFTSVAWPPRNAYYPGDDTKWYNAQRYKMLAGFVHIPAQFVGTKYWLKIDVDTIANGYTNWIDERWFENDPAIVAHKWGFTKPPNQMDLLDEWAAANEIPGEPINLHPETEESSRVSHKRIISWCGFFRTDFTHKCSNYANYPYLPVPSQDGYMFYMAKRLGYGVQRVNMKGVGWVHRSTMKGIKQAVEEATNGQ